jgi:hypothetical protein
MRTILGKCAVTFVVLSAVGIQAAQDRASATATRNLISALNEAGLEAIAAADPLEPGAFVAALHKKGGQLLVVCSTSIGRRAIRQARRAVSRCLRADAKYTRLLNVLIAAAGRHVSAVKPVSTHDDRAETVSDRVPRHPIGFFHVRFDSLFSATTSPMINASFFARDQRLSCRSRAKAASRSASSSA